MSEWYSDNPPSQKIDDLLPRYYEARGDHLAYEVVRSIPIDGHEVAWMKYSAENADGGLYEGHELHCACDFTEEVGWRVDEQYGVTRLDGEDHCLQKKAALYLRQQELREEYLERFRGDSMFGDLWDQVPEIMMDLIEKDKAGEFIGEGHVTAAHLWGGHFYLHTIVAITEIPYDELWKHVEAMKLNKQIQLTGTVVREYREPR